MSIQTQALETPQPLLPEQSEVIAEREAALMSLLDPSDGGQPMTNHPNYEYAKDAGLIDMFYFDPVTGEDGLRHVLEGDMYISDNGARKVTGFHHEPSSNHPDTYIDYDHLAEKQGKELRDYRRSLFGPYNAPVVVKGYPKNVVSKNEDGSIRTVSSKSAMFPNEYDQLAIMQAAKIALENRDPQNDEISDTGTIIADGFAPMLDGERQMKLRFFLDADTHKIRSVFPVVRRSDTRPMTDEQIQHQLGL